MQLKHTIITQKQQTSTKQEKEAKCQGRAIQATEPGSLSDRSENPYKMFFELY